MREKKRKTELRNTPQPHKDLKQRTPEYFEARSKCDITASEIKKLLTHDWECNTFVNFFDEKRFHRTPKPIFSPAIRHGIEQEPNAADIYEALYLPDWKDMRETGLWVEHKYGASPDRLIYPSDSKFARPERCLEIKCPYSPWNGIHSVARHIHDWVLQVVTQELVVKPLFPSHLAIWSTSNGQAGIFEVYEIFAYPILTHELREALCEWSNILNEAHLVEWNGVESRKVIQHYCQRPTKLYHNYVLTELVNTKRVQVKDSKTLCIPGILDIQMIESNKQF